MTRCLRSRFSSPISSTIWPNSGSYPDEKMMTSYLDERLFAADDVAVHPSLATVEAAKRFRGAPDVSARLGRRYHVERNRKRTALVDVVHPETRPRELPLDIAVRLRSGAGDVRVVKTRVANLPVFVYMMSHRAASHRVA